MKTAEQVAREATRDWFNRPDTDDTDLIDRIAMESESGGGSLHSLIADAIEADRAQRENDGTVHAAVIDALEERRGLLDSDDDRGSHARIICAVEWIENEPDEFWEEFAGPMLDEIERKFR